MTVDPPTGDAGHRDGQATPPGGGDPGPRPDRQPRIAEWGLALDLGIRLGISVILGLVIGLGIDTLAGTRPLFTLIGVFVGVAAALYTIWDVAAKAMRK